MVIRNSSRERVPAVWPRMTGTTQKPITVIAPRKSRTVRRVIPREETKPAAGCPRDGRITISGRTARSCTSRMAIRILP